MRDKNARCEIKNARCEIKNARCEIKNARCEIKTMRVARCENRKRRARFQNGVDEHQKKKKKREESKQWVSYKLEPIKDYSL